jgi:hypothetical protein
VARHLPHLPHLLFAQVWQPPIGRSAARKGRPLVNPPDANTNPPPGPDRETYYQPQEEYALWHAARMNGRPSLSRLAELLIMVTTKPERGMTRVKREGSSKTTQTGGSPPKVLARLILSDLVREHRD